MVYTMNEIMGFPVIKRIEFEKDNKVMTPLVKNGNLYIPFNSISSNEITYYYLEINGGLIKQIIKENKHG